MILPQIQILGGSFERNGDIITAGVHDGPSEFEFGDLRYVQGKISDMTQGETVRAFLGRVYANSTGCVIKRNFQLK